MIVSGGLNVYPREVELVLEEHPRVERAAVVGVPSERWGEEVVGVVEGDVDGDELIRFARERLSAYKCPKRVVAVDALPVGDTGKVRRSELVELIESREEEG
jgi:malonyl-CoA/methylmalonyl-CoA synthetase